MRKGQKNSPITIKRMRVAAQRRAADPAYRRKLSEASKQRALRPTPAMLAGRKKMAASLKRLHASGQLASPMKGKRHSPEMKARLSASMIQQYASGSRRSSFADPEFFKRAMQTRAARGHHPMQIPGAREKMAATLRRRFAAGELIPPMHRPGAREKMSLLQKGVPKSEELKQKVSLGMKRAHAEGRAALGWRYVGHPSKGERTLAPKLRRHGFIGQYPFAVGRHIRYKIDFAHPMKQLAVEIDGKSHQTSEQLSKDRLRDKRLRTRGWAVLRLSEMLARTDPKKVICLVLEKLNSRR